MVAVIFAVTTGFSFLAAKYSLRSGDPIDALFFRFAIGFAFALIIIGGMKLRKKTSERWAGSTIEAEQEGCEKTSQSAGEGSLDTCTPSKNKKSKWGILIPALLYSCGFFGFQFFGLLYASSIEAGIIMACQPAITMVVAELAIKEKSTGFQRVCVAAAILSAIFISVLGSGGIGNIDLRGVILIFLSALSMAGNVVFVRWKRGEYKPTEISLASCAMGFAVYTTAVVVRGIMTGNLMEVLGLVTVPSFIISTAYLGIACTMLTTLMNSYLMVYLEAVKTSVFGCAGTVITLIAGHYILGESLTLVQVVFSEIILLAIIGTNLERFPKLIVLKNGRHK